VQKESEYKIIDYLESLGIAHVDEKSYISDKMKGLQS